MDQQDDRASSDGEAMDYVGQASRELAATSERKGHALLANLLSLAAKEAMATSNAEDQARYEAEFRRFDKAGECS